MKWIYGEPMKSGPYLCAVMGQDKPVLMYWQGCVKDGGYWIEGENAWDFHSNKDPIVLYYMDPSDITMPEGW